MNHHINSWASKPGGGDIDDTLYECFGKHVRKPTNKNQANSNNSLEAI